MNYKTLIKIIFSIIFLIIIGSKIDINNLINAFISVNPWIYLTSFSIMVLNSLILAKKYEIALYPAGIDQTFFNLVKINFIVRFYSIFLSTIVGQGIMRWYYITKKREGKSKFLAVMLLERSSFLFTLFFIILTFLLFFDVDNQDEIFIKVYPLILAGLILVVLYYLFVIYNPMRSLIAQKWNHLDKKTNKSFLLKIVTFLDATTIYHKRMKIVFSIIGLSFIWHLFYMVRVFLLVTAAQIPIDFLQLGWIASIVLLLQVLPISFSGIGLRETAFAFMFTFYCIPQEKGVLIGMLLSSQVLVSALIGGFFYAIAKE